MVRLEIQYAILSAIRALWDEITPQLRAVTVFICPKIRLSKTCIYYDGAVSEDQIDLWNCVMTEATADFNFDIEFQEIIKRVDYPGSIPDTGRLVYLRKEPLEPCSTTSPVSYQIERHFQNDQQGIFIDPKNLQTYPTTLLLAQVTQDKKTVFYAKPSLCPEYPYKEAYAVLSVNQALIGKIIPELRAVICEVIENSNHVFVRMFYDRPLIKEILLEWESAFSQVMADFGANYTFDMQLVLLPHPKEIPFQGRWVYLAKNGR